MRWSCKKKIINENNPASMIARHSHKDPLQPPLVLFFLSFSFFNTGGEGFNDSSVCHTNAPIPSPAPRSSSQHQLTCSCGRARPPSPNFKEKKEEKKAQSLRTKKNKKAGTKISLLVFHCEVDLCAKVISLLQCSPIQLSPVPQ